MALEQDWRWDAACASVPNVDAVFFPRSTKPEAAVKAKQICARCPVLEECAKDTARFEWGKPLPELDGVFAMKTPEERWRGYQGMKVRLPDVPPPPPAPRPFPRLLRSSGGYDTQQTSAMTGATDRQLRHWDKIGLVRPSVQGTQARPGRWRIYSEADLFLIRQIVAWRREGRTLQSYRRQQEAS